MLKRILGLDLGSYAIKVAEFQQTWNGLTLVRLCQATRHEDEPLSTTLRPWIDTHSLTADSILCAIPATQTTSRHLSFPFRDRKKIAQAVPFELAEQLPFELDDFLLDWELIRARATESQVFATLTQRKNVEVLLAELREADLDPNVIEAEGLVLGNLASFFELPDTRLLLDLGHSKTNLCLLIDGKPVASRTIALAGFALTQEIARARNVDFATAEQIKHEGIFQDGLRCAVPGVQTCLDRIAREMIRSLEALEPLLGGSAAERVAGISIFGGTAQILHLDEYLSERTGLPTQRLQLPESTPKNDTTHLALDDPTLFGGAIALGLRGTTKPKTTMNFRQGEFAYRFDFANFARDFVATGILAGVALLLGITLAVTTFALRTNRAQSLEASMQARYQEIFPDAPASPTPLQELRKELDRAHEEADFLGLYRGDRSALDLLTEIATRMPPNHVVLLREVRINRNLINLRGQAKSFEAVDQFKARLNECEAFTQVDVSEVSSDAEGKVFSMTIGLVDAEQASSTAAKGMP